MCSPLQDDVDNKHQQQQPHQPPPPHGYPPPQPGQYPPGQQLFVAPQPGQVVYAVAPQPGQPGVSPYAPPAQSPYAPPAQSPYAPPPAQSPYAPAVQSPYAPPAQPQSPYAPPAQALSPYAPPAQPQSPPAQAQSPYAPPAQSPYAPSPYAPSPYAPAQSPPVHPTQSPPLAAQYAGSPPPHPAASPPPLALASGPSPVPTAGPPIIQQLPNEIGRLRPIYPTLGTFTARGEMHAKLLQRQLVQETEELGDEYSFHSDFAKGELIFSAPNGKTINTRCHLMASIAPGPRSVLWGWAMPRSDDVSRKLQEYGQAHGIKELTEAELPFPPNMVSDEQDILDLAHELGQLCVGVLGRGPYYTIDAGNGSRLLVLVDAPFPPVTVKNLGIWSMSIIAGGFINARESVLALGYARGWRVLTPDASTMVLQDDESDATFKFDEHNRVVTVSGRF
ncbi:hypothetical protein Q8F55_008392 [Vanrija albida]|uniref:Uncharacterized protein n=1 Tax=Vanrija albida TaxID=181172 RepID=A0ABR3PW57_9TREE